MQFDDEEELLCQNLFSPLKNSDVHEDAVKGPFFKVVVHVSKVQNLLTDHSKSEFAVIS